MEYFVLSISEVKKSWFQRTIFFPSLYIFTLFHSFPCSWATPHKSLASWTSFLRNLPSSYNPALSSPILLLQLSFLRPGPFSFSACLTVSFWPRGDCSSLFSAFIKFATSHEWQGCLNEASMPLLFSTKPYEQNSDCLHFKRTGNTMPCAQRTRLCFILLWVKNFIESGRNRGTLEITVCSGWVVIAALQSVTCLCFFTEVVS